MVALTIVDGDTLRRGKLHEDSEILVAVRRPETNSDHGDVASVPTQRIPQATFRSIAECLAFDSGLCSASRVVDRGKIDHFPLKHATEAVMARKLGLADPLERGDVNFVAEFAYCKTAPSPVINPGDRGEMLTMVNILVQLRNGRSSIPPQTASYSALAWVTVSEFLTGAQPGHTLKLRGGAYAYHCGGLCVCTTDLLLRALPATARSHADVNAAPQT